MSAPSTTSQSGMTDSLDGLRGLLAIWVMFSHISQFVAGPGGIVTRGGVAVDLFMLVSGFLMVWTVSMRESKETALSLLTWKKFFIRRFFRIAPLFFLLLIPAYLLESQFTSLLSDTYAAIGRSFYRPFRHCAPSSIVDILTHLTFVFGLFPCTASVNVLPDWSLSLEMQFYAVFPLIFIVFLRTRGLAVAIFCSALAGFSQSVVGLYEIDASRLISYPQPSLLPLRINCFLVGMVLALLVWRKVQDGWLLAALLVSLLMFQRLTFIAIALPLALMFFARANIWLQWAAGYAAPLRILESVLRLRPLRFCGDVSFGVYLVHILLLLPLVAVLNSSATFRALSGNLKFVGVSIIATPLVIFVAWQLHVWIEKPMIDFGRRLTSKRPITAAKQ